MIRSMTGFGRGERRTGSFAVSVEIRSVNHRHAEFRVKVPPPLAGLEDDLRQRLSRALTRGRVDAQVTISGLDLRAPVEVDHALVAAYLEAASRIASRHGLEGAVSLESVLSLPGVVSLRNDPPALGDEHRSAVGAAFEAALAGLESARAAEGRHLASDLEKRLRAIERLRASIGRRARGMVPRCAKRLRARIAEIDGGRAVDPARLAQEVAILASRSDITEELVRLEGHVRQARQILKDPKEPAGKRLDFLLQEMHREANTINSKSEDLGISRDTLTIKAEVEKIREQVQNVE